MIRLDPAHHPWMTEPGVRAVTAALEAARPGAARFVGGCVRNALMGRPIADVDIATQLTPEAVMHALKAADIRYAETGVEHGTLTAVVGHAPYEITTLRRDVETDGRRAVTAYTEDWEEDSARRDFRLNAVYAAPDGALFDPQGGIEDARAGRIVFIGEAEARIREDYLRILRFFRFHAWYGMGALDADGLRACRALAPGLAKLSVERVWKELNRLLAARDPGPVLKAMAEAGVMERVLPEAIALDLIDALTGLEFQEGWEADPLLRLEALIPRMPLVVARVKKRLKLSNAEADRLAAWAASTINPRLLLGRDETAWAQALYGEDRAAVADRARLAWAIDAVQDEADPALWRPLAAFLDGWEPPALPVTGDDMIANGVPKGPGVGAALKALEALWVKGNFTATKEQLLAALPLMRRG